MQFMKDVGTAGKVKVITEEHESDILTRTVNDKRSFQHLVRDLILDIERFFRKLEQRRGCGNGRYVI
jgi:hypothetical protein